MRFLALGPLLLSDGDATVRPGSPREQTILAALLIDADQTVSVDRLVDVVWADNPPASARTQVAISVSALRRTFAAAGIPATMLVTRAPGYLLRAGPDEVDIRVFHRILDSAREAESDGRLAEAATEFREALGLWRGRPFDGLHSVFVESIASRLEDQRLTALEQCIAIELELGRHQPLVSELRKLVDDYPHRERLVSHLMIALYRCGRQVEALDVFRMVRITLVDELGLEPGGQLQELEQRILRQDITLTAPAAPTAVAVAVVPRQLPADIAEVVGREAEAVAISEHLAQALEDQSDQGIVPICLIVGAGGVGKTTLAVHAAHQVRHHYPDGQLYVDLRGVDATVSEPLDVLAGFLRALGRDGASIPDSLEERAALYRSLLAGRRVLVVLDNAATERQVEPLLPGTAKCGLIITGRSLLGVAGARVTEIGTLSVPDAVALLATAVGPERIAAEPDITSELVRLCGGLPLALRIAAARLAARPYWRLADLAARLTDERRRLDELTYGTLEVRASLAMSYHGLDVAARTLFRRLGWLDVRRTSAWVSAALLDVDIGDAEETLGRLVDARLLEAGPCAATGMVRYDFHELVRVQAREQALAEEPPEFLAAAAERAFGGWLMLAEEAHRRESGGDYTLLHGTAPRWPVPADLVDSLLDHPLRWFEGERHCLVDAVRRAAVLDQDEVCWDLAFTAVTLYEAGNYLDDWRRTHERALAVVRRRRNVRGEAVILYSVGALHIVQQRTDEARAVLEPSLRLFETLDDRHGRALVTRNLAYLDRSHGEFDRAMQRYELARQLMRESGDLLGEAHVLGGMAQIHLENGDDGAAESLLRESLAISERIGSKRGESQARHRLGGLLLGRGALDEAEQAFRRCLELVRGHNDTIGEAYILLGLGETLARAEQHAAADQSLQDALRLAQSIGEPLAEARTMFVLGRQAKSRDQPEAAIPLLEKALALFESLRAPHWAARVTAELTEIKGSRIIDL